MSHPSAQPSVPPGQAWCLLSSPPRSRGTAMPLSWHNAGGSGLGSESSGG